MSATQTTRSGYGNSDIELTDTSESFGLPATADFMFALISNDELNAQGKIMVKQLKNRQIGVLITDHNVRETLDIVDRACIIYDGRVLFSGSPKDLVADENVRRLYLGESFSL